MTAPRCECGGMIVGSGGLIDTGGHYGRVWGGNCTQCGRGYGENQDEPVPSIPENTLSIYEGDGPLSEFERGKITDPSRIAQFGPTVRRWLLRYEATVAALIVRDGQWQGKWAAAIDAYSTLLPSPAVSVEAPTPNAPLQAMDGGDWKWLKDGDVLRIGNVTATRAEWIAAIERLAPLSAEVAG